MSSMYSNACNTCTFVGRVSSDPQFTTLNGANGSFEKARFSIAVDRSLSSQERQAAKNGDNSIKTADFINFEATGNVVTSMIKPYVTKGKSVVIKCRYNQWQQQNQQTGQNEYRHNFIVEDIAFAPQDAKYLQNGGNGGGQQNNNGYQQNYQQNNNGYQQNNNQQQQPRQQQPNNDFAMFDDNDQPF